MRPSTKPFASPKAAPAPARRTLNIRSTSFYLGFAALMASNMVSLVGLLMAPDIASLFVGQNDTILSAYEDRISQLRLEVDRLQSRNYAQSGDINLQLQELQQTQELLLEQHQYVRQLTDKAVELGIETAALPEAGGEVVAVTGSIQPADPASAVAAAAAEVNRMMQDSQLALAALSEEATDKTDRIVSALRSVGIHPDLPSLDEAVGGPLLPPIDGSETPSLVDGANDVAAALERYRAALGAAYVAPIHSPLATSARLSSTFGNRKDPFTSRPAFHSGIDFAALRGTAVLSAGAGRVSFVGQKSGYGNVVEIDHGNGLITRYGHLSAFLVKEGQSVKTGTPIARVGSTGRSTGPHLHFEVRKSDDAVDPAAYLNAGKRLVGILVG